MIPCSVIRLLPECCGRDGLTPWVNIIARQFPPVTSPNYLFSAAYTKYMSNRMNDGWCSIHSKGSDYHGWFWRRRFWWWLRLWRLYFDRRYSGAFHFVGNYWNILFYLTFSSLCKGSPLAALFLYVRSLSLVGILTILSTAPTPYAIHSLKRKCNRPLPIII